MKTLCSVLFMLLLISSIFYSYNQVTYNRTALFQKNIARLIFIEQNIGPILESDLENTRENTGCEFFEKCDASRDENERAGTHQTESARPLRQLSWGQLERRI